MNIPLIIFISLVSITALGTALVNLIIFHKKSRYEKRLFSKEQLEQYETILEQYLKGNDINDTDSIFEICSKLGYSVEECSDLPKDVEANIVDNKIIRIHKDLSIPEKNFDTAHEIAHVIRGAKGLVMRTKHSIKTRDEEEQICDYFAAALLLPLSEMKTRMEQAEYKKMSKKERLKFVSAIAEKKDLCEEVVIRRIVEIRKITE